MRTQGIQAARTVAKSLFISPFRTVMPERQDKYNILLTSCFHANNPINYQNCKDRTSHPSFEILPTMYSYEHLQNDDDIRLIELAPARLASPGGKLDISILTFAHRDAPDYEALSYVWGDPSNPVTISANGQDMQIGRNLYDALMHIQHDQQPRTLWVDAICINQRDNAEKSKQVLRMRDIYTSAVKTLMWLGKQNALPSSVLDNIQDAIQTKLWIPIMDWTPPRPLGPWIPIPGPPRIMFDDTILDSLGTLWDQEYFSRSWITQEIAVSSQLILICGSLQFDFNEIIDILKIVCRYSTIELRNQKMVTDIIEIRQGIQEPMDGTQGTSEPSEGSKSDSYVDDEEYLSILHLLELLSRRRYQSATDPRDKVYAFLGVSRDSEILNIEPNYSISVNGCKRKYLNQGCRTEAEASCSGIRQA
jgi:hypothetical protein